jgi:DNA-binding GntR family transcriptional regulator
MTVPAVRRVADEVRRMIVRGELLPGHPVRQELTANRPGVSRLPVREAWRQLAADGLVRSSGTSRTPRTAGMEQHGHGPETHLLAGAAESGLP